MITRPVAVAPARRGTPALNPSTDPLVGRVIDGRYKVLDRLGTGGMGTVYRVVHERMQKVMAVKMLNPQLSADPVVRARFRREARAASLLESRNTVAVFDFGETDDGLLYLAMEYLRGRTLASLLKEKGTIGAARASRALQQVLRSLEEAHTQGIVHRDIKPDNIFLVESDEADLVKVLDFGIAKGERIADALPTHATRSDLVVGTPEYMSPEQARGQSVDGRADLWAVGIILYESLVGHLPFTGETPVDVLVRLMERALPRPPEGTVPPGMWRVLERALQKKASDRYASSAEMRAALVAATAELSVSQLSLNPTPIAVSTDESFDGFETADRDEWDSFARGERRKRNMVLAVTFAALAGLGAGAWRLMSPGAPLGAEQEPNDKPALANAIGPDANVTGSLQVPVNGKADEDFFTLLLPPGPQVLSASVQPVVPTPVNLGITAWVDNKVVFQGYGKMAHARITNLTVEGKALYLKVREENATSDIPPSPQAIDYRLDLGPLRPLNAGEEREGNNTRESAGVLAAGQQVTGWVAPADDEDWFKVPLPADDRDVEVDVGPATELALEVSFHSSDGKRVARRTGRAGEPITLKVESRRCGAPCFVMVQAAGRSVGADPAYRLTLR